MTLYLLAAPNAHAVGEFGGNFHERLGHELHVHGIVFRPVVIVLGEAVRRADDVVSLLGGAVLVHIGLVFLHDRIVRLIRMQRIRDRAFDRLVEFGERPIGHGAERNEEPADAFGIHDEWTHVIFGRRIGFEIGNVVAHPLCFAFVPPDLPA